MTEPKPSAATAQRTPLWLNWVLGLSAFAVGAAVMALEIVASRFLTPVFGGTVMTWASLIAVVMVALTVGYLVGGKVADRWPRTEPAGLLVVGSAFYLLLVSRHAWPLLLWLEPLIGSPLQGALAGAALLTFVPVALLATYTPYAVRLSLSSVGRTGRTSGALYGISTVGSVFGTLFSAFVLVPRIGSGSIVYLVSLLALATGALVLFVGLWVRRPRAGALVWPLLLVAVHTLLTHSPFGDDGSAQSTDEAGARRSDTPSGAAAPSPASSVPQTPFAISPSRADGTIETRESPYSSISIVKEGDYLSMRFARVDRYFSQSQVNLVDASELPLFYTRLMLTGLAYPPSSPRRLLLIGMGGGTTARYLKVHMPELSVVAVELDGDVIDLARKYFDLPEGPDFTVEHDDGRLYLNRTDEIFDLILIDAFRGGWKPFHMATREFFALARSRLAPEGCVVVNLHRSPVLIDNALGTVAAVFDHVDTYFTEESGSLIAVAYMGDPRPREELLHRASTLQAQYRFPYHLRALLEYRRDFERDLSAGVMRDDFAPTAFLEAFAGHNERPTEANRPRAARDSVLVDAPIVRRIEVDGDLSDWPDEMPEYAILTSVLAYGPADVDGTDLRFSTDLSPRFMVGYNPGENLLYVAVLVRDEALVVGSTPWDTDACEVYVAAEPGAEPFVGDARGISASELPVLQYVAVPGEGSYGEGAGNPSLSRGQIADTRTRVAYTRRGDVTIYEWAIEVYDHYPDRPARLTPGKVIGFDVIAVDKDGDADTPAWICWGPAAMRKYADPGALARLVLGRSQ